MQTSDFEIHRVEDISVIGPVGELDRHESNQILGKIRGLIERQWDKIILDLRGVEHVHYRFLSDLLPLATVLSLSAGGIKLANLRSEVKRVLTITGADRYLETYESVADAILSFGSPLEGSCVLQ